eukprot:TRINITY_DN2534_c0_g1_i1.p1 TRINITY_DN2534_c0_g1~~TRINITY_DN2534_c0_g1_i1.p1  ORF type:complete len:193 (-),score=33.21 TRINITY_DN2534_c0_g1_i1:76-615(-)
MVLPNELVVPLMDDMTTGADVEKKSREERKKLQDEANKKIKKAKGKVPIEAGKKKKGLLRGKLIKGENLPAKDVSGTSDPYCLLTIGDQTWKSKVIKKSLNPTWKERFQFELYEGVEKSLHCTVFDWDRIGGDDSIGSTTSFAFDKDLTPEVPKEVWLDMVNCGGRICVELVYYPDMMV